MTRLPVTQHLIACPRSDGARVGATRGDGGRRRPAGGAPPGEPTASARGGTWTAWAAPGSTLRPTLPRPTELTRLATTPRYNETATRVLPGRLALPSLHARCLHSPCACPAASRLRGRVIWRPRSSRAGEDRRATHARHDAEPIAMLVMAVRSAPCPACGVLTSRRILAPARHTLACVRTRERRLWHLHSVSKSSYLYSSKTKPHASSASIVRSPLPGMVEGSVLYFPGSPITFTCKCNLSANRKVTLLRSLPSNALMSGLLEFATLLCALFGFLFVRKTPVPRRGPLRRRYPTAYQYSNSVYSTQAADITPP